MKKLFFILTLFLSISIGQDCDEGFTPIDNYCYFEEDIDVLEVFIDNSENSINMILDINSNGVIEPLELCDQQWDNGRITSFDCNPIIINNEYNWIHVSGELPGIITNWESIEVLLMPYNELNGLIPDSICELSLDFSDINSFDLHSNNFCPPYPECIEDYIGGQSNWGSGNCDVSDCYDVGVAEVAVIELNGDGLLNPAEDFEGVGVILSNVHNDGPSCSQYPGLMISTDTPGVTFPNATLYEEEGQIIFWWYAIFAESTYFSNILFEVSPFVPIGTPINFSIETVTMGCLDETCSEDPYCHDCPLTPAVTVSMVVGESFPNMLGDVNLDSTLDILDIILVVNYILNTNQDEFDEANQLFFYLVNMNGDYQINILDIIQLVNIILNN